MAAKAKVLSMEGAELARTVKAYLDVRQQIKILENTYGILKEELLNAAVTAGGMAQTATHVVRVVEQERKTIYAERLIECGVTPKIIDKATIVTPGVFARVDPKKER